MRLRTSSGSLRVVLVAVVLIAALLTAGCPADKQHQAAVAMNKFAVAVDKFQDGEIALYRQGRVPQDVHLKIQQGLKHTGTIIPSIDAAIKANNKAGAIDAINAGLGDTDQFLADVGVIEDPNTRLALQGLVLTLQTILNNGKAFLTT